MKAPRTHSAPTTDTTWVISDRPGARCCRRCHSLGNGSIASAVVRRRRQDHLPSPAEPPLAESRHPVLADAHASRTDRHRFAEPTDLARATARDPERAVGELSVHDHTAQCVSNVGSRFAKRGTRARRASRPGSIVSTRNSAPGPCGGDESVDPMTPRSPVQGAARAAGFRIQPGRRSRKT